MSNFKMCQLLLGANFGKCRKVCSNCSRSANSWHYWILFTSTYSVQISVFSILIYGCCTLDAFLIWTTVINVYVTHYMGLPLQALPFEYRRIFCNYYRCCGRVIWYVSINTSPRARSTWYNCVCCIRPRSACGLNIYWVKCDSALVSLSSSAWKKTKR